MHIVVGVLDVVVGTTASVVAEFFVRATMNLVFAMKACFAKRRRRFVEHDLE
jgi:hypothetical protein